MKVNVLMMAEPQSVEDGIEGAQDLAWDHAVGVAQINGLEIGSQDFINTHGLLLSRYTDCAEHAAFIQHTALRILQAMLLSHKVALVVSSDSDKEAVVEKIQHVSDIVCSGLMWFFSSYPNGWITDRDWHLYSDDARGVEFTFSLPDKGGADDDSE